MSKRLFGWVALVLLAACSSDEPVTASGIDAGLGDAALGADATGGDAGGSDARADGNASSDGASGDTGTTPPPPPALGTVVIDRAGRPLVNVAMTAPFDLSPGVTPAKIQDDYNSASKPSLWVQLFSALLANNLALFDGIDGTCGNQLLAGAQAQPGRYDALAALFADDQLYLDTAQTTCQSYLALELKVQDCGGRTLREDVVDATYALLSGGSPAFSDGIASDADGAPTSTFPFLTPPNP